MVPIERTVAGPQLIALFFIIEIIERELFIIERKRLTVKPDAPF
jgi:hypothetical protein